MAGFCPVDREPCREDCPDGHCEHAAERLAAENAVRDVLAISYTPEGVERWLWFPNQHLSWQTPRDAIREGRGAEVLQIAQAIEGGG